MTPDRYRAILAEYDMLTTHACTLSHSLTGRPIEEKHMPYVDTIFTKLICHGISLRKLSPSLGAATTHELWDLASACAVARALIEAHDALAYIGVQPVSPSEREFRILLWELHDQQRRLTMLEGIGSVDSRVDDIRGKVAALLREITTHRFYFNASKQLQARVARGEAFHLSQREQNAASGINQDYYVNATMFLSQYVHTLPFSVRQLMHSRAGEPGAIQLASMPLQYAMPFIAKAVEGMNLIWPDGQVERTDHLRRIMDSWLKVAANGVKNFDQ